MQINGKGIHLILWCLTRKSKFEAKFYEVLCVVFWKQIKDFGTDVWIRVIPTWLFQQSPNIRDKAEGNGDVGFRNAWKP